MMVCDDAGAYDSDGNSYQSFMPKKHVGTFCHIYSGTLNLPPLQFRHYFHFTDEGKEAQETRGICPRSPKCIKCVDHRTLIIKGN